MNKNWRTLYQCESCKKLIANGVGGFDSYFFLPEFCSECGEHKAQFEKLEVAYSKWSPKLFDWFNEVWISRDGKIIK